MKGKHPKEREKGVTMRLLPIRAENNRVHLPAQLAGNMTLNMVMCIIHDMTVVFLSFYSVY